MNGTRKSRSAKQTEDYKRGYEDGKKAAQREGVYAVIDGEVLGVLAFYENTDATAWMEQHPRFTLPATPFYVKVHEIPVFRDIRSAPKTLAADKMVPDPDRVNHG